MITRSHATYREITNRRHRMTREVADEQAPVLVDLLHVVGHGAVETGQHHATRTYAIRRADAIGRTDPTTIEIHRAAVGSMGLPTIPSHIRPRQGKQRAIGKRIDLMHRDDQGVGDGSAKRIAGGGHHIAGEIERALTVDGRSGRWLIGDGRLIQVPEISTLVTPLTDRARRGGDGRRIRRIVPRCRGNLRWRPRRTRAQCKRSIRSGIHHRRSVAADGRETYLRTIRRAHAVRRIGAHVV